MTENKPTLEYASRSSRWILWTPRLTRRLKRLAMGLVIFVGLGYVSNFISVGFCERSTARWYAAGWSGRPFYVDPGSTALFASIGLAPTLTSAAGISISKKSSSIPFLVDVIYNDQGGGGVKTFFCLFGLTIELGESESWRY